MLKFELPASDAVKAIVPTARINHFMIGQLPDFIETARGAVGKSSIPTLPTGWNGNVSAARALELCEKGDMAIVEKSNKYLKKLEALMPPPSARHAITDDVTGAFPNVPAMLAGQPLNMRRRVARESEYSPLTVIVALDCLSVVKADQMRERGLAALALVRAVSSIRPVELWVGSTVQGAALNSSASTYFQIPTTPLDLARAAHLIGHPSTLRILLHSIAVKHFGTPSSIPLAFDVDEEKVIKAHKHIVAQAFPRDGLVMSLPRVNLADLVIADPIKWLHTKIMEASTQ